MIHFNAFEKVVQPIKLCLLYTEKKTCRHFLVLGAAQNKTFITESEILHSYPMRRASRQ